MEAKKMAAYYCKRMIPQSLLFDDKSKVDLSSSESFGLGKNSNVLMIKKIKLKLFYDNI